MRVFKYFSAFFHRNSFMGLFFWQPEKNFIHLSTGTGNLLWLKQVIFKDQKEQIWGVQINWLYKAGGQGAILETSRCFGQWYR